jgi:hypothetical protein
MKQIQIIGLEPSTLINLFDEKLNERFKHFEKHFQPKEQEELLTRLEVSKMFKIDLSSVHNWTKKGIIKSYQCSGRIYYKRSELQNAIVELKK